MRTAKALTSSLLQTKKTLQKSFMRWVLAPLSQRRKGETPPHQPFLTSRQEELGGDDTSSSAWPSRVSFCPHSQRKTGRLDLQSYASLLALRVVVCYLAPDQLGGRLYKPSGPSSSISMTPSICRLWASCISVATIFSMLTAISHPSLFSSSVARLLQAGGL